MNGVFCAGQSFADNQSHDVKLRCYWLPYFATLVTPQVIIIR